MDSRKKPHLLRREKGKPCEDLRHTLAIGLPIAAILFIVLPLILR